MKRLDPLFTVYELFQQNDGLFPFWIKNWNEPETCLCVIGWSRFFNASSRGGVPHMKTEAKIRTAIEIPKDREHDFLETGTFVGYRYLMDKETLIGSLDNSPLVVAGASTRSWLPA